MRREVAHRRRSGATADRGSGRAPRQGSGLTACPMRIRPTSTAHCVRVSSSAKSSNPAPVMSSSTSHTLTARSAASSGLPAGSVIGTASRRIRSRRAAGPTSSNSVASSVNSTSRSTSEPGSSSPRTTAPEEPSCDGVVRGDHGTYPVAMLVDASRRRLGERPPVAVHNSGEACANRSRIAQRFGCDTPAAQARHDWLRPAAMRSARMSTSTGSLRLSR